ncbi:MAG: protein kinase domain-containing protein [Gemmatimonadales bacterium]
MGELAEELRDALAGRYRIERELGRGGMATVYLAQDLRHDRPVALKVLHSELASALGPERFQREIKLAARLQHPHILTVHDSGESPGAQGAPPILWFSMPFIEGESLRSRLTREKQLSVDEALQIARETADALDYAHRHGVIHRDIKPENILLSEGHALVADFGISKALARSAEQQLTETGIAIGTPAYMSPEQAAGQSNLDARTDIYSLATVLYEMLAGETPFAAPTAQAMIARRFMETPRPLRQLRESVPDGIDQAVQRGLARTPADRFSSAAEFSKALSAPSQTMVATVAVSASPSPPPVQAAGSAPSRPRRRIPVAATSLALGFLLGLGLLFGWLKKHGAEPVNGAGMGGTKLLAVLPFENLGSADDEYFADGVTDEIRGKLAALPGLRVTASRSAAEYKKSNKDLATIARELGVDYLLVGKVRWEKGDGTKSRVRVSPELIQVSTGSTRWQEPFDANLTDVFQVQADVAGRVAQALDVALGTGDKATLAERPTQNLAAYDAYLKGEETSRNLSITDPNTLRRSLVYYEQAIALDSSFAVAWAQRSRASSMVYANSVPDPAMRATALESAERARRLAPDRPEGYLALADYHRGVTNNSPETVKQAEAGLKIAPANVNLLVSCALGQQSLGRWEEATELLRKAQAIDPRSIPTAYRIGRGLLWLHRYDEALAAIDRGLQLAPGDLAMLETRALILVARGDSASARAAISSAASRADPAALVAYVATYYDMFWLLSDAQRALLFRLTPSSFDGDRGAWGLSLAGAYAQEGDQRRAHAYADSASISLEQQMRDNPSDAQLHALNGVALAYLGRKADAVREGERSIELLPVSQDAFGGAYNEQQLIRIYILVGEQEKALDRLEALLKIPYFVTTGWLKVDPTFDPLRKNPRFQRLLEG